MPSNYPHLTFGITAPGQPDDNLLLRYRAAVAVHEAVGTPLAIVLFDWSPAHIERFADIERGQRAVDECVECGDAPVDACARGRMCAICYAQYIVGLRILDEQYPHPDPRARGLREVYGGAEDV